MSNKVQKIKQEIERLDEEYRTLRVEGTTQQAKEADLVVHVLQKLENFIDSIPEETTVKGITWEDVNTLESLIYQVHNEYPSIGEKSFGLEVLERFQGCQDDIEEPASEDLEEYAKKLAKGAALDKHNLIWMCKKGAEWQKQKDLQDFLEKAEKILTERMYFSDDEAKEFKNYMKKEA